MKASHSLRRQHSANEKLECSTGCIFRYTFYVILGTFIFPLTLKYSAVAPLQRTEMESLGRENVEEKSTNYPGYIQLNVFGQYFR